MTQFEQFLEKHGAKMHEATGRRLAPVPTGPRAIDREGGVRTKPMRVLLASMSRTGTFSMYNALQTLGYSPYHMAEAIKMPERDLEIGLEALKASRGSGKPFGREEFDKWIGDFDAVCDVPMCLLVKELVEAYPGAKVVFTTRDPATWRKSIDNTVLTINRWRIWGIVSLLSTPCRSYRKFMAYVGECMDGWSMEALARHDKGVRGVVPKDKMLEFKLGQDGWKELCSFLDVPQPEGEFPNTNDGKTFIAIHIVLINMWMLKAMKDAAVKVAPLAVLAGGAWYARRLGFF